MIATGQVKGTTVTVANTATPVPATALSGRKFIILSNVSGVTLYYGDETVTTANGCGVDDGKVTPIIPVNENTVIYAVSAAGSKELGVLEFS